jgi:hypothetical protein
MLFVPGSAIVSLEVRTFVGNLKSFMLALQVKRKEITNVKSEVMAVKLLMLVFWDVMLCGLVGTYQCSGGP